VIPDKHERESDHNQKNSHHQTGHDPAYRQIKAVCDDYNGDSSKRKRDPDGPHGAGSNAAPLLSLWLVGHRFVAHAVILGSRGLAREFYFTPDD
jgi:hypothetical protein